jgi:hypothetical protein
MTHVSSSRSGVIRFGLATFLVLLLLAANTTAIYLLFTSGQQYAVWDFHPLWLATRALLLQGQNPYSQQVTREIQLQMYGRLARPDEVQYAFAYPMYLIYLKLPVAFLPLDWAQAAWFSILEFAVVFVVLLLKETYDWGISPWLLALTIVWAFAFYPVTWGILLGQTAILVTLFLALALWALKTERDYLAGFFLAFSTVKPQMAFLLIAAILLWMAKQRQWRLVTGFLVSMAFLIGSCMLLVPTWPLDFWRTLGAYVGYTIYDPPVRMLANACCGPALGGLLSMAVTLLVSGYLFWSWWHCRGRGNALFWAVGLTISVTSLVAPRTTIINQTAMVLPLCFLFRFLHKRPGWGAVVLAEFLVAAGLWLVNVVMVAVFAPTADGSLYYYEHLVMAPVLPIALTVLLWLLRRPLTGA